MLRDGERRTVEVELGERPAPAPEAVGVRDLVRDLALALREQVLPSLGSHAGACARRGEAAGGDVTFAIDAAAEASWRRSSPSAPRMWPSTRRTAASSSPPGAARAVLVVDPIDGTRPALAGLESCCVSVAAAPLDGEPTMGDVTVACVVEIPSGQVFLAERGAGLVEAPPVRLSRNERSTGCSGPMASAGGRRARSTEVLAELIDASSVGGGPSTSARPPST